MSRAVVRRLVAKDIWLMRWSLAAYVVAAVAALVLTAVATNGVVRGAGVTLALNVLIGASFHVMLGPVLGERERRTLAFVMTLPVRPRDVALAKLVAAFAIFLLPAVVAVVTLARVSSAGVLTLYPVILGAWICLFAIVLAAAIVTESLSWTIATLMTLMFVVGNGAMQVAPHMVVVSRWLVAIQHGGGALALTAGVELVWVASIVALTLLLQGRKTSFV
jgi:hypothetical protein